MRNMDLHTMAAAKEARVKNAEKRAEKAAEKGAEKNAEKATVEKVIDTYNIDADDVVVEVNIIERKKDFVHEYNLNLPEIGAGTMAMIADLKNNLISLRGVATEKIIEPKQIEGMKPGDEKKVTVPPQEAYGMKNPAAIQEVKRSALPENMQQPQVGMMLQAQTADGRGIPGVITQVNPDTITVDLNHPLAGKTLEFDVKVISVE